MPHAPRSAGGLSACRTTILWEGDKFQLVFREPEPSPRHQYGFVCLVTNKLGRYRLIVLSKPAIAGEMFGILSTLQSGKGPQLLPVAAPIVFEPIKGEAKDQPLGKIGRESLHHVRCAALIRRTVEEPLGLFGHPVSVRIRAPARGS